MSKVYFKANAKLKNIIGKDLIQDDITAVSELVKNSMDALATEINIQVSNEKIIISDNGIGMSDIDIKDKWLNIAHSGKIEKKGLAGSKGIGRFSCDKLGKNVEIRSKKKELFENDEYNTLSIDWTKFENTSKDKQITNVPIDLGNIKIPFNNYNTIIEVNNLRERWDVNKLKRLQDSLEKLVKPQRSEEKTSTINIYLNNELIENKILEYLNNFGTFVISSISKEFIEIALFFRSEEIFSYRKKNNYKKLYNIDIQINHLTPTLKAQFARKTGFKANDYGSIFMFNNGFRVKPFGDSKNDYLGLGERKSQGHSRYLGPRDLLGYISVDDNAFVSETSSREGLDKSGFLDDLTLFIKDEVISSLEYYLDKVVSWDNIIVENKPRELTKEELNSISNETYSKFANYISKKADSNIDINKPYLDQTVLQNQEKIQNKINKVDNDVRRVIEQKEKKTKIVENENKILQSKKEIEQPSLIFHDISNKLVSAISSIDLLHSELENESVKNKNIEKFILNAKKSIQEASILSNFGISGIYDVFESNKEDNFINVLNKIIKEDPSFSLGKVKIHIDSNLKEFNYNIKISYLNVSGFLNNIYSNSYKSGAKNIYIDLKGKNQIIIWDDGSGLSDKIEHVNDIFRLGLSTTYSSGMGMHYIKDFIENKLHSKLKIDTKENRFKIIVELNDEYIA